MKNHNIQSQNDHWQPLHKCCPFCYLHFRSSILFVSIKRHYDILLKVFFSIYSLMEEIEEDTLYFFTKPYSKNCFKVWRNIYYIFELTPYRISKLEGGNDSNKKIVVFSKGWTLLLIESSKKRGEGGRRPASSLTRTLHYAHASGA